MFKKNTSLLKLLRAGCLFACSIYNSNAFGDNLYVRVKVEGRSRTPRANNCNRKVSSGLDPIASPGRTMTAGAMNADFSKTIGIPGLSYENNNTNINCTDFRSLMQAMAKGMIGAIKQEGEQLASAEQIVKAINAKRESKQEKTLDTNNAEESLNIYTANIETPEDLKNVLSELGDLALFVSRIGFVIDMDAVIKPVLCAQGEYKRLAASMSAGKIKSFSRFIGMDVLPTVIDSMVEDMPNGMTESFLRSLKNRDGTTRSDLLGMLEDIAFTLSGTIDNEWRELLNALYESVQDKRSLVFKVSSSSKGKAFQEKHLSDIENLLHSLLPEIYKDKDDKPSISVIENDSEYKVSTVSVENMETTRLGADSVKKISNHSALDSKNTDYPGFEAEQALRSQLSIWSADTLDNDYIELDDDSKPLVINHIKNFWVKLLQEKVIPEFWKMQNNSNSNQSIDVREVVNSMFEQFDARYQHLVVETSTQVLDRLLSDHTHNAIMRVAIGGGSPLLSMFRHNDSSAQTICSPVNAIGSNTAASSGESATQKK